MVSQNNILSLITVISYYESESGLTKLTATQTRRSLQAKKQGQMEMKVLVVPDLQQLLPEGRRSQAQPLSAPVALCSGRGAHQHQELYKVGTAVINVMTGLLFA